MTTATTCIVCGASEEPTGDHTCPVCGADLPVEPEPAPAEDTDAGEPTAGPPPEEPTASPTDVTEATDVTAPADAPTEPPDETVGEAPPAPSWPATPPPPPPAGGPAATGRRSPYDPSHPSGLSSDLRTYGMFIHLSAFASALVALAFVGPLVMWLIRRDEHPFVDHHGKEATNFNLSMLLYGVIGLVASIATLGFGLVVVLPAAAILFVTWIVLTIMAAVKANQGEGFRYPLTIRFIND